LAMLRFPVLSSCDSRFAPHIYNGTEAPEFTREGKVKVQVNGSKHGQGTDSRR
jgi:hypothetical protein